ncbi:MAG: sigma-70 family RNA polymerase sigma factor [Bacteroidetes bacterium]|nr:MAG: sigma-70 family RNA polymerase sigma factor [Bacteroidota bacterium]
MLPSQSYNEAQLVALLQSRSQQGFTYLYDHYSGALYHAILALVTDADLANDVLQEVFINIFKRIDSYDASRSRLYTWMLNIARNAAIDMLRSKGFRQMQQNREATEAVYEGGATTQTPIDQIGLRKMVGSLKQELSQVLELAYFGGYTQEEISHMLELPLGTVKTRVRTALKQLRTLMQ